ncbi:hypothetical protein [Lutispora sp.]|uniref:hypothetical protein n=1 Tax=Lutispora sp. TaxID=2828727 RepID=UPI00356AB84C
MNIFEQVFGTLISEAIKASLERASKNNNRKYDNNNKEIQQNRGFESFVQRFIEIYKVHGIEETEISGFLHNRYSIKPSEVMNKDILLEKLSRELIDITNQLFNLHEGWLECGGYQIYKSLKIKTAFSFINEISRLIDKYSDVTVLFLTNFNEDESSIKDIYMLLRAKIETFNNKEIYKYYPVGYTWYWGDQHNRYDIKSIIHLCDLLDIPAYGYRFNDIILSKLFCGCIHPSMVIKNEFQLHRWEPILFMPENELYVTYEKEEYHDVLEYMREKGIFDKCKDIFRKDKTKFSKLELHEIIYLNMDIS